MSGFVPYFEDKVEKWKGSENAASIRMKRNAAHFNTLVIEKKRGSAGFFDFEEYVVFTALTTALSGSKVAKKEELCLKLKSYECELNWHGLLKFRSHPRFQCASSPLSLKYDSKTPNDKFAATLNSDKNLIELIKHTKPDVLSVVVYIPFFSFPGALQTFEKEAFDPKGINWLIVLRTNFSTSFKYKKRLLDILKILDLISEKAIYLTKTEVKSG